MEPEPLGLPDRQRPFEIVQQLPRSTKPALLREYLGNVDANADQGAPVLQLHGTGLRPAEDAEGRPELPCEVMCQSEVVEKGGYVQLGSCSLCETEALSEDGDGLWKPELADVNLAQYRVELNGLLETRTLALAGTGFPALDPLVRVLEGTVHIPAEVMEKRQLHPSVERIHGSQGLRLGEHAYLEVLQCIFNAPGTMANGPQLAPTPEPVHFTLVHFTPAAGLAGRLQN